MSTSFYIFVVCWLYKSLAIVIKAGARRATLKYIWGGDAATNGTGHHMQTPLHIQYHNAKLGLVTPSSRPKIKGNQWIWSNNKITWKWNKSVSPPTWCNAQLILRLLPTTTFWAVFFFVIVLFYFKIEVASFKAIDWCIFLMMTQPADALQNLLVAHLAFAVSCFFLGGGHGQLTNPICSDTFRRQKYFVCWFQVFITQRTGWPCWECEGEPPEKNGHRSEKKQNWKGIGLFEKPCIFRICNAYSFQK